MIEENLTRKHKEEVEALKKANQLSEMKLKEKYLVLNQSQTLKSQTLRRNHMTKEEEEIKEMVDATLNKTMPVNSERDLREKKTPKKKRNLPAAYSSL